MKFGGMEGDEPLELLLITRMLRTNVDLAAMSLSLAIFARFEALNLCKTFPQVLMGFTNVTGLDDPTKSHYASFYVGVFPNDFSIFFFYMS